MRLGSGGNTQDWNKYSSYDREHIYQRNLEDFIE